MLKPGDLSEAEVEALLPPKPSVSDTFPNIDGKSAGLSTDASDDQSTTEEVDVKVIFRKPEKRPTIEGGDLSSVSTKKIKQESVMEKVANKSLLSFDQDYED